MSEFISRSEICVLSGSQAEALISNLKVLRNLGSRAARKLLKVISRWFRHVSKEAESDFCFEEGEIQSHRVSLIRHKEVCGSFYYLYDRALNKMSLFVVEFVHLSLGSVRIS